MRTALNLAIFCNGVDKSCIRCHDTAKKMEKLSYLTCAKMMVGVPSQVAPIDCQPVVLWQLIGNPIPVVLDLVGWRRYRSYAEDPKEGDSELPSLHRRRQKSLRENVNSLDYWIAPRESTSWTGGNSCSLAHRRRCKSRKAARSASLYSLPAPATGGPRSGGEAVERRHRQPMLGGVDEHPVQLTLVPPVIADVDDDGTRRRFDGDPFAPVQHLQALTLKVRKPKSEWDGIPSVRSGSGHSVIELLPHAKALEDGSHDDQEQEPEVLGV
ncbi:hypothetical protein BHE74_00032843 [Ensete ventricosum]|nr:hypothetical protein BHE74_00032843 [Ensete ventricosum]